LLAGPGRRYTKIVVVWGYLLRWARGTVLRRWDADLVTGSLFGDTFLLTRDMSLSAEDRWNG